MIRLMLLTGGIGLGVLGAVLAPAQMSALRANISSLPGMSWAGAPAPVATTARGKDREEHPHDDDEGVIKLSDQQIQAAGIDVADVGSGVLGRRRFVPGTVVPSGDRIARVAVRLLGTVAELRKRLGDPVEQNEVVAVIESREVADAKSEYPGHARDRRASANPVRARDNSLAEQGHDRERLPARAHRSPRRARQVRYRAAEAVHPRLERGADRGPAEAAARRFRRQELRSPIAGRIAERRVDLGALVGREGQESELYVVVDLSELWVDLAVSPADLALIRKGRKSPSLRRDRWRGSGANHIRQSAARSDTRSARVVASLANPDHMPCGRAAS